MLLCTFKITGISDLMFGRKVSEPKRDDETDDQHQRRTWQQKVHVDPKGQVFIQPFAIKNGLESAGSWLGMKVAGSGKATYTKRLKQGILVVDRVPLFLANGKPATMENVDPMELFVPSDGKRGSGKRVTRIFPTLHEWNGTCQVHVLDNKITGPILEKHAAAFGKFIGIGSMRVEGGGINGRFSVSEFEAVEEEVAEAA